MSRQTDTLIFWGAGATQALGIRTTRDQGQFIRRLAEEGSPSRSLEERVTAALADKDVEPWHSAFVDLICILGDSDDADQHIHNFDNDQVDAMRRNWKPNASDEEIRKRIASLRLTYDWPALKSAVRTCPGGTTDRFRLNDLFNLLDMHIPLGAGFRAPTTQEREPVFLHSRRLIGAKNALLMLLIASFYVDYQMCIASRQGILQKYSDVAMLLARRTQRLGRKLAADGVAFDSAQFYQGDIAFVSMNYDPILLWVQFVVNRELNQSVSVPHVGDPPAPIHLFNDFGHLIPSRRIHKGNPTSPWYPMNEAASQRLNETGIGVNPKIRLTKVLFPHGCLCWRECPDCGKLSAYHADRWELLATGLIPPPPLLAFDTGTCPDGVADEEKIARVLGRVDARSCLHCGTLTFAHHTQIIMQTSFKPRPPSFIEEIQRDLRATAMHANHIVLLGYSLPPDDVTYRAFLSARRQRESQPVRCTVVNKDDANPGWYRSDELPGRFPDSSPVNAAIEVFGEENVRFFGGGIPEVFLDHGVATEARLDQLLVWI